MVATIDTVEVHGHNPSNKVKRARRDSGENEGNRRFSNLRANWLRITGSDLDQVDDLKLDYTVGGHTFKVLEMIVGDGSTILDAWFVVWKDATDDDKSEKVEPDDLGDLTVTVETVTVTQGDDGEADDVIVED